MAFHIRVPHNVVVQEKLPAVYFSVDEGAVLFVREEHGPAGLPVEHLFHEIADQRVTAFVEKSEDRVQREVRQEHIVGVAEHIRSNIACGLYYFMASAILNGDGTLPNRLQVGLNTGFEFYEQYLADHENLEYYDRLRDLGAFAALPEDRIQSSGYVVDALEAAVWSLVNTDSFENALLKAVNLGDDTDTVGAIAGGLAGLFYSYDAIPEEWLAEIQRREWIEGLCAGNND
ncbi:MAG: ADP-ribosylglycohydrolase family protein [Clostridia bacterium]|nr:ADP-ribosylglycohydrolase family protein [Clostridia bacterium]